MTAASCILGRKPMYLCTELFTQYLFLVFGSISGRRLLTLICAYIIHACMVKFKARRHTQRNHAIAALVSGLPATPTLENIFRCLQFFLGRVAYYTPRYPSLAPSSLQLLWEMPPGESNKVADGLYVAACQCAVPLSAAGAHWISAVLHI